MISPSPYCTYRWIAGARLSLRTLAAGILHLRTAENLAAPSGSMAQRLQSLSEVSLPSTVRLFDGFWHLRRHPITMLFFQSSQQ